MTQFQVGDIVRTKSGYGYNDKQTAMVGKVDEEFGTERVWCDWWPDRLTYLTADTLVLVERPNEKKEDGVTGIDNAWWDVPTDEFVYGEEADKAAAFGLEIRVQVRRKVEA